ncbi:MAG: alpha-glucosidase C-terminal domain-containing protein [Myxococcales bacterium]|nr:alpha-glucosidase C-terminal domain-containing protein [Myxococcales bacterium]
MFTMRLARPARAALARAVAPAVTGAAPSPAVLLAAVVIAALAAHPTAAHAAAPDGDIEWDGVFADTTAGFVQPARVVAGEPLSLSLRAWAGDLTSARCVLYFNGPNQQVDAPMQREVGPVFDRWSCTALVPAGTTEVYYRFALTDGADTDWYDAGDFGDDWPVRGMSDEERVFNAFRLYVDLTTPTWAQGATFYQIFPDRFADGLPANNRLYPEDCVWYLDFAPADPAAPACAALGVDPGPPGGKRCLHHADWEEAPTGSPCDWFGGDLTGIEQRITYLDDLGVDAVYLNPVFRSPSNHKYDTMDYEQVDPRFGGTPALDSLTRALHARGLRIIADGVFNHVSDLGVFFNGWLDYAHGADGVSGIDPWPESCGAWEAFFARDESGCAGSEWASWFRVWAGIDEYDVDRDGDRAEPATHTCGWAGLEFMPEIDYGHPDDADSPARTWLYGGSGASNPAVARQSLAGKWLADGAKMAEGLDGWRLDVPDNAGYFNPGGGRCDKTATDPTIWQGFRRAVKAVAPDKYISGEIWTDASDSGGLAGDWFRQRTYDAVMNYHYFATPLSCLLSGTGVHADPGECRDAFFAMKPTEPAAIDAFDRHLAQERRVYPAAVYLATQNMLSSHDSARFASRVGGDHRRLRLAMTLQAALPGAPMIYYGDEIGLGDDVAPADATNEAGRATMPWSAFEGDQSEQADSREHQRRLLCLRDAYPALRQGSFLTLHTHNQNATYAFARFDGGGDVIAIVNNAGVARRVSFSVRRLGRPATEGFVDLLGGDAVRTEGHTFEVTLEAFGSALYVPAEDAAAGEACAVRNRAPIADAGADRRLESGAVIVLDGSASRDPDGHPLSYRWTDATGALVTTDVAANLAGRPDGRHVFTLTVEDGVYHARAQVTYVIGDVMVDEDMGAGLDAGADAMPDDGIDPDEGIGYDPSQPPEMGPEIDADVIAPPDARVPGAEGDGINDDGHGGGGCAGCDVGDGSGGAPVALLLVALGVVTRRRSRGAHRSQK